MIRKVLSGVVAVTLAAALTLAALLALVQGTINAVSLESASLRVLAVLADIVVGGLLLIGCVWIATRIAVLILGVGNAEFPPLPEEQGDEDHPKN